MNKTKILFALFFKLRLGKDVSLKDIALKFRGMFLFQHCVHGGRTTVTMYEVNFSVPVMIVRFVQTVIHESPVLGMNCIVI